jgi:hypothetical protein
MVLAVSAIVPLNLWYDVLQRDNNTTLMYVHEHRAWFKPQMNLCESYQYLGNLTL